MNLKEAYIEATNIERCKDEDFEDTQIEIGAD